MPVRALLLLLQGAPRPVLGMNWRCFAGASGNLGYINGPGFVLDDWKASIKKLAALKPERMYPGHGTFLLGDATSHLLQYDAKMNAAWTTIITSVG